MSLYAMSDSNSTVLVDDGKYSLAIAVYSVVAPVVFVFVILMLLMFFVAHILR